MFKLPAFFTERPTPQVVGAVDLGSNSFHMLVARIAGEQIQVLDRLREMVRLGAGLDENNILSIEAQQRALACLKRFGQRLREMPVDSVRIVGTNVLRAAKNAQEFLEAAEATLNHPIEIISGREEARLVYLGVAHSLASGTEKRLVIDIGGGSTEFIIGQGFESLCRESINMGCVSMTQRYFSEGSIRTKNLRRAEVTALLELQPIEELFQKTGWDTVIGASGTMRAVGRVIREMGWGDTINLKGLQELRRTLLDIGSIEALKLKGLGPQRTPVFIGGVAILLGIFEGLQIEKITISDGALREGLVYDMLGRITHEDVRERTIQDLSQRYLVDVSQAERIADTALACLSQVAPAWDLVNEEFAHMLSWAARLHEIGLNIAHENYHKHSEYLLIHSDLAGFSRQEQLLLATLVRVHARRRFPNGLCEWCPHIECLQLTKLCVLLRLAVLLHRSRLASPLPEMVLQAQGNNLSVRFPPNWLEQHPLTQADLEQENHYLQEVDLSLSFE
jgi:exopolyphosphatase/guanosine-5'-triphosphate,3'-diphosphate pyrophosphatase